MLPDPEFHLSEPVIAVERVIAELRAARDIILYEGPDFIRVTSVESLRGTAERLILSAARLRWLGLEVMQAAYAEAIREKYRFYSYGDACLLIRPS